jgi:hypothetical protein
LQNNVKFRISASKFFLTRFPQQVLFARVYGKRLTFFFPRSLVQKPVMSVFGQGKFVRVYGRQGTLVPEVYFYYFHCEGRRKNKPLEPGYRQGKTIMVLANKTPS